MQNDDFNIDVVIAEITAFAENMHAKNQHKKKVCLRCMMIIPLVFMVLMFTMDTIPPILFRLLANVSQDTTVYIQYQTIYKVGSVRCQEYCWTA